LALEPIISPLEPITGLLARLRRRLLAQAEVLAPELQQWQAEV
jgi:hypothetical protein